MHISITCKTLSTLGISSNIILKEIPVKNPLINECTTITNVVYSPMILEEKNLVHFI